MALWSWVILFLLLDLQDGSPCVLSDSLSLLSVLTPSGRSFSRIPVAFRLRSKPSWGKKQSWAKKDLGLRAVLLEMLALICKRDMRAFPCLVSWPKGFVVVNTVVCLFYASSSRNQ